MAYAVRYRQFHDYQHCNYNSQFTFPPSSHSIRPQSIRPQSIRPQSIRPQSIRPQSQRPQSIPMRRKKTKKKPLRKMKIKIFQPNGKFIQLHIAPTAIISEIKRKIENRLSVAMERQQLVFQDKELNDDYTLLESNCPTAIFLSVLEARIQIFIKTMSGNTIKIKVNETATVQIIKEKIENEEGIAVNHQRLIFDGKELDDNHAVSDYGITSGATLYSALRFRTSKATAAIYVDIRTTTNNKIAVLHVDRNTMIQEIKTMIEQKTNIFMQYEDELMFAGQTLENTLCLSHYDIYNNSTLYLQCADDHDYDILKSPSIISSSGSSLGQIPEIQETFDIYINIPEMDLVIQIEVDYNDTIKCVKERIEKTAIISPEDQMLTYFHKLLVDEETLCHYHIDCESVLQLKLQGFSKFLAAKLV